MNTDFGNYRTIGDVSYDYWLSELQRVDSPLLPWSREIYDAVQGHSALALAHMWRESQYETDRLVTSWKDFNPFNMKRWSDDPTPPVGAIGTIPTGLPGDAPYLRFDSPVNAAKEWRKRVIDDPTYKGGVYTRVSDLADYIETYAPAADFHAITGVNNSTYYRDMVSLLTRYARQDTGAPDTDEGTDMTDTVRERPYILLVAGHRSIGDGGNPVERGYTDDMARAYLAAFRGAGFKADIFQEIDGDALPDMMTAGGLDGVARGCQRIIQGRPEKLVVMLDLHFNGATSGVHVIVPHNRSQNGGMLNTAYVAGRVADDVIENNPLDANMARAIAAQIVKDVSGMYLWGSTGLMLENQTGVGMPLSKGGQNSRLAMMSATAPSRLKAVRLTVEHGGTNDFKRPDFAAKCANAALKAVKTVLAIDDVSTPPVNPDVPTGDPGEPALLPFLFGEADGYTYDPRGPVSTLWRETGATSGKWPRLVDVREVAGDKWFAFGDGSVIVVEAGKAPRYLVAADVAE